MLKRNLFGIMLILVTLTIHASEREKPVLQRSQVIPVVLTGESLTQLDIQVGDEIWFELAYSVTPGGKVIHTELAEKIWWIQDRGLLILGATGLPLPSSVTRRATVYVHIFLDDREMPGSPFVRMPQKETIIVGPDVQRVQKALASRAAVDASYLSQVANYLAANLTALNVQGTSYSVTGYSGISGETVINSSGEWTGEAVSRTTAWTEMTTPADHLKAKNGGLALDDTQVWGTAANSHVNLGNNNSTTGWHTGDYHDCTVGGGNHNTASHDYATVSGGSTNTASGSGSTISGGWSNDATNYYSTVGGGYDNHVAGSHAVITGGQENTANGNHSWVGGRNMQLDSGGDHTFVWGYAESPQSLSDDDAFLIFPAGVTGKVGINLPNPTATLDVAGDVRSQVGGTYFHMVPQGAIIMWSGTLATIPSGWQLCDGTNNTPDLRNRFVYGVNSGENPGAIGGQDSVTLTVSQMPAHSHPFTTNSDGAHSHQIMGDVVQGSLNFATMMSNFMTNFNVIPPSGIHSHTGTTDLVGTGSPVENRPAYYKLAFIMKMP